MEARCYRGGQNRTRMKSLHFTKLDAQAALCVGAVLALAVIL